MKKDLTKGSVLKNVIIFSLPYLLSYFLQTLYGMADLFIIGQFDTAAATTAVSIGSQVMHMLTVIIVGLSMGTTVCIGQSVGAQDNKSAALNVGNTVTLFGAVSIGFTAVLLTLVNPITAVMSTPPEAVSGTRQYLVICFIGIPFITAYNIISSIFRGMGDSKSPMYFIAVACAANIALDYLFIGVFNMGAAGAALGTTLSQAISVVASLSVILKRKLGFPIQKSDLKPRKPVLSRLLKIGIPVALQDGFIQISFIIITVIANRRGLADAAAVGIVEKIISFLFLIPSSMLSTVSALGAQNIGAKKPQRAVKTLQYAVFIAVGFGVAAAVVMQFAAKGAVSLFAPDAAVAAAGAEYMKGYVLDCVFAGIHFCFSGYFCAIGRSELSFLHNIASILLARIPGAYFMSKLFPTTLFPMGLATAAGSFVSAAICIVAFMLIQKAGQKALI